MINVNMFGDIWICELEHFQLGHLISQLEVHRGELQKAWTGPIQVKTGHMLTHKDHVAMEEAGGNDGVVQYQLPAQFFKPENQEHRVYWNRVFGGAAHVLVSFVS